MKRFISLMLVCAMLVLAMPAAAVSADNPLPFTDVKPNAWYYDAVVYNYNNGIVSGTSATTFSPSMYVTRAMFVKLLANISGIDETQYTGYSFSDVPVDQWYAKAVKWAAEKGYVSGIGGGRFNPEGKITREQMSLMLYNYASDFYDTSDVRQSAFDKYKDASSVSSWAAKAVRWMSSCSLISGTGTDKGAPLVSPQNTATRAEAAQILMNYKEMRYNQSTPVGEILLNGNPITEYTIVYGTTNTKGSQKAKYTAETAATNLQKYLKTATGETIPVAKDTETPVGEKEILIGKTNREGDVVTVDRSALMGDGDALLMQMQGDYLILASNEEYVGTHYAVYEFLENYVGYTFYGAIETVMPKNSVSVPGDLNYTETATMHFRENYQRKFDKNTQLRNDTLINNFCNLVHSLGEFAQPDYDGSWEFHLRYYLEADPCLTDPQIQQNIINSVKLKIASKPDNNLIWVTQNDGSSYCKCNDCKAFYSKNGRCSTYVNILNIVGEAIEDEYPDYSVVGLAYKYTYVAPKNMKTRDNVIMCVCTDNACSAHAITDPSCKNVSNSNVKFLETFEKWCDVADNIYVWDYTTGDKYVDSPFPNIYQMYYNMKYFYDKGVKGTYVLGATEEYADFGELKTYLVSQMQWNSNITWNQYSAMVNNFLRDYYGDGWTYIREYIDKTHELASKNEWHIWSKNTWNQIITEKQYDENFDYLMNLWNKAKSLTSNDEQLLHVKKSMLQIKYIELVRCYEVYRASQKASDLEAFKKLNNNYKEYMESLNSEDYKMPENWSEELDPMQWKG